MFGPRSSMTKQPLDAFTLSREADEIDPNGRLAAVDCTLMKPCEAARP
jgi:hypothetical protein